MDRKEVIAELTGIFRKTFQDETISIDEKTTRSDIGDWDSLNHAQLIYAIELRFDIKFSLKEMINFSDVGRICEAIESKFKK